MTNNDLHRGAIAILYWENQYLMQLRDDIPHIIFPGQWALFGGHIEPHESPEMAVQREIWEEVGYKETNYEFFRQYITEKSHRYVFSAPLTVPLSELTLNEGYDMALLTVEQILAGRGYSIKAQQHRTLAPIHQKILLDFFTKDNLMISQLKWGHP